MRFNHQATRSQMRTRKENQYAHCGVLVVSRSVQQQENRQSRELGRALCWVHAGEFSLAKWLVTNHAEPRSERHEQFKAAPQLEQPTTCMVELGNQIWVSTPFLSAFKVCICYFCSVKCTYGRYLEPQVYFRDMLSRPSLSDLTRHDQEQQQEQVKQAKPSETTDRRNRRHLHSPTSLIRTSALSSALSDARSLAAVSLSFLRSIHPPSLSQSDASSSSESCWWWCQWLSIVVSV